MEYLFMEKSPVGHQYLATVRDEESRICFILVGRIGRKNDQIHLYNHNRVKLGTIIQKNTKLYPNFELNLNNDYIGTLKHLAHFGYKDSYYLTKKKFTAFGDLKYQSYNIYSSQKIMSMNLLRNLPKETFQIAIMKSEDKQISLLIAAVLNYLLVITEKNLSEATKFKKGLLPQFRGSFYQRESKRKYGENSP